MKVNLECWGPSLRLSFAHKIREKEKQLAFGVFAWKLGLYIKWLTLILEMAQRETKICFKNKPLKRI